MKQFGEAVRHRPDPGHPHQRIALSELADRFAIVAPDAAAFVG